MTDEDQRNAKRLEALHSTKGNCKINEQLLKKPPFMKQQKAVGIQRVSTIVLVRRLLLPQIVCQIGWLLLQFSMRWG